MTSEQPQMSLWHFLFYAGFLLMAVGIIALLVRWGDLGTRGLELWKGTMFIAAFSFFLGTGMLMFGGEPDAN